MIEEGKKAPNFSIKNQKGKTVNLTDFAGKKVAIYFYPKDNTPGCTKQACSIRDGWKELREKEIVVLGISKDSLKSHTNFSSKFELPFDILSDEKGEVIEKYGVFKQKSIFGKTFLGIQRTTFLINEKGIIIKIIKKPIVAEHAFEILKGFE